MSTCGDSTTCATVEAGACPGCRTKGEAVEVTTVKALLTETALARLEPGAYRFCTDATCATVYFDESGHAFSRVDLRVPVWQKEPFGQRMVCYCFGENEAAIRAEIASHGVSAAMQRVTAHIQADRCACEVRNPAGRCCLGDLSAAVKRMAASLESRNDA